MEGITGTRMHNYFEFSSVYKFSEIFVFNLLEMYVSKLDGILELILIRYNTVRMFNVINCDVFHVLGCMFSGVLG